MSQGLRPAQRIRSRRIFQILFKRGKLAKGTFLNLWSLKDPEILVSAQSDQAPQLGVIVSRKVSVRATKRNLWKRRIREAFRRQQSEIKRGTAILIQARSKDPVPAFRDIEIELRALLKKTESFQ